MVNLNHQDLDHKYGIWAALVPRRFDKTPRCTEARTEACIGAARARSKLLGTPAGLPRVDILVDPIATKMP